MTDSIRHILREQVFNEENRAALIKYVTGRVYSADTVVLLKGAEMVERRLHYKIVKVDHLLRVQYEVVDGTEDVTFYQIDMPVKIQYQLIARCFNIRLYLNQIFPSEVIS